MEDDSPMQEPLNDCTAHLAEFRLVEDDSKVDYPTSLEESLVTHCSVKADPSVLFVDDAAAPSSPLTTATNPVSGGIRFDHFSLCHPYDDNRRASTSSEDHEPDVMCPHEALSEASMTCELFMLHISNILCQHEPQPCDCHLFLSGNQSNFMRPLPNPESNDAVTRLSLQDLHAIQSTNFGDTKCDVNVEMINTALASALSCLAFTLIGIGPRSTASSCPRTQVSVPAVSCDMSGRHKLT